MLLLLFEYSTICSSETLLWNIRCCGVKADSCFLVFAEEDKHNPYARDDDFCISRLFPSFFSPDRVNQSADERWNRSREIGTKSERVFVEFIIT